MLLMPMPATRGRHRALLGASCAGIALLLRAIAASAPAADHGGDCRHDAGAAGAMCGHARLTEVEINPLIVTTRRGVSRRMP